MDFGDAIRVAKQGKKIARKKWNGKNMYVVYMDPLHLPSFNTQGTFRKVNDRTAKFIGEDKPLNCQPYFAMYNAQEEWIPGWVASQSDMLDNDWFIVEAIKEIKMKDYQKRVLTEQKELSNKIINLTVFITDFDKTKKLDELDFNLLNKQLEIMLEYHRVLQMRVVNFKET